MFRQVADLMFKTGRYHQALIFYQPLRRDPQNVDATMLVQMGKCFLELGDEDMAKGYLVEAVDIDPNEVEGRMELARLHEKRNEQAAAFDYVNEVMLLKRGQQASLSSKDRKKGKHHVPAAESFLAPDINKKAKAQTTQQGRRNKEKTTAERMGYEDQLGKAKRLQKTYQALLRARPGMRANDYASTNAWLEAATCLTDDFRSFKAFYPWDKYLKFLGYSSENRIEAEAALDADLTSMAERLSKGMCQLVEQSSRSLTSSRRSRC